MKTLKIFFAVILFSLLFAPGVNAQDNHSRRIIKNLFDDPTSVFALDLDGSTEYASKTTPVNLDLNGSERVLATIDRDMEVVSFYASNFTAGGDGWVGVEATVTGNIDGVWGQDDVLRIYGTGTVIAHFAHKNITGDISANYYARTFSYYIPAQNDTVVQIRAWVTDWLSSPSVTTVGTWTTYTDKKSSTATASSRLYMQNSASSLNLSAADDTIYVKDVSLSQVPNYRGNGNTTIDTSSVEAYAGTYSGRIISTGAGSSSTNFISLAANKYTPLVSGEKYTKEFWAYSPYLNNDSIRVNIGSQTKSFGFTTTATWEKKVWNFQATAAEVGQPIKLYLNQADTCYIDDVSLKRKYDATYNAWFKTSTTGTKKMIMSRYVSSKGIDLYIGTGNKLNATIGDGTNTVLLTGGTTVTDGVWRLATVKVVWTDSIYLFLNGVRETASLISTIGDLSNTNALNIGFRSADYFNGLLGEIQGVRDYGLTASEILTTYNRGLRGYKMLGSYTGGIIVAWYTWKGDGTTFLYDKSGTGNNLTGTNITIDDRVKRTNYKP